MNDLISRSALRQEIESLFYWNLASVGAVLEKIDDAPAIATDNNVGGKWIPVTERLPEIIKTEHAWHNVYRKSGRVLCACLQADGKRMTKEGYMQFFNDNLQPDWIIPGTIHAVTHWMPLPEPPKEG